MGIMRNAYEILAGNLKVREYLVALALDGRIILKWVLEKYGVRM
jgi:hypothetical protein